MKLFIVLALCMAAVVAEDLHARGVDFHTLHYSQHHQTLEEAKRKIADVYDGQHTDFEEVGTYGGVGGVGLGTVGFSSSGLSESEFGSSSGSSSDFSTSGASNFGAPHLSNFASSSSLGSNANFASGAFSSGSQGGSAVVIPLLGGAGSTSYLESSAGGNIHHVVPEIHVSGSAGGHDSFLHHEEHLRDRQVATPLIYSSPSGGSEKYYRHEERRVSNVATPVVYTAPSSSGSSSVHHEERRAQSQTSTPLIQFAPSSGGSENYVHHEERRLQNQAVPVIQYSSPSGNSENYVHVKSEHVQTPVQLVVSAPAGGQESFMKYRKVTTSGTQPQLLGHPAPSASTSFVHQSSSGTTTGSQLGHLVNGGLSGINTNYKNGYFGNSGYSVPSTSFGSDSYPSANSNSLFKTGFGGSHQSASNFGAGHQSGFGSSFGADSSFGSASSTGLHNYMQESERLAKAQSQGMSVGGSRAGGSQFNANMDSGIIGNGGFGGLVGVEAVGGGNPGYKTKSWEKASKWSSQSQFGSDGHVNNYKELSTGESENYDINGRRTGYKAATTTLDDNGKVSSYSLHS